MIKMFGVFVSIDFDVWKMNQSFGCWVIWKKFFIERNNGAKIMSKNGF